MYAVYYCRDFGFIFDINLTESDELKQKLMKYTDFDKFDPVKECFPDYEIKSFGGHMINTKTEPLLLNEIKPIIKKSLMVQRFVKSLCVNSLTTKGMYTFLKLIDGPYKYFITQQRIILESLSIHYLVEFDHQSSSDHLVFPS